MLKLQFIAALLVAAAYELWKQASGILGALRSKQQVSDEVVLNRLHCCVRCPVFYAPLGTCGSPLKKHTGPGIRPGCFCYMNKAATVHHDCWLYEQGREGGWPEELNSSYILANEQTEFEQHQQ